MKDGLQLKYFVLNPTSSDTSFAWASCQALREFAVNVVRSNPSLYQDLMEWVEECESELRERET